MGELIGGRHATVLQDLTVQRRDLVGWADELALAADELKVKMDSPGDRLICSLIRVLLLEVRAGGRMQGSAGWLRAGRRGRGRRG